jgi:N-acetylneuraminate synthase/sialic acid synthase
MSYTQMLFPDHSSPNSYIIAEVGQNHQGDVDLALNFVECFSMLGANAIKFQMRSNKELFSDQVYNRPYHSDNAFGSTYGEHREKLELSLESMVKIKNLCVEKGIDFIVTPFDEESLFQSVEIGVDAIKVASFDLGNIPFLNMIKKTGKPVIMSTGGGQKNHLQISINVFKELALKFAVLHCVSLYPCPYDMLQLNKIRDLSSMAPDNAIGLSDHFNGILSGPVGFMNGARVFEKHVTFDRSLKGTDHSFSLEPIGFEKFCRDIRRVAPMLDYRAPSDGDEPVFKKLGKSLVLNKSLDKGATLKTEDLSGRIFETAGIPVREVSVFIGRKLNRPVSAGEQLSPYFFDEMK